MQWGEKQRVGECEGYLAAENNALVACHADFIRLKLCKGRVDRVRVSS